MLKLDAKELDAITANPDFPELLEAYRRLRDKSRAEAMAELERQLSEHLGTSVKIRAKPDAKRGSLVIKFYDLDHFDGLMGKMGFRME